MPVHKGSLRLLWQTNPRSATCIPQLLNSGGWRGGILVQQWTYIHFCSVTLHLVWLPFFFYREHHEKARPKQCCCTIALREQQLRTGQQPSRAELWTGRAAHTRLPTPLRKLSPQLLLWPLLLAQVSLDAYILIQKQCSWHLFHPWSACPLNCQTHTEVVLIKFP